MRRETQNILLVLTGGALLKIAFGDTYLRYVKPSQQPLLIIAGVVILALAAVAIVRDIKARQPKTSQPRARAAGHDHARSAWLLTLPVLAIFVVAPPALGADSVDRDSSRATAGATDSAFPPLPRGAVVDLSVTEFVTRAGWDTANSLDDRTVELTGFVVRDGESLRLARMVVTCCAADAAPLSVRLHDAPATGLRSDDWITVTGQLVPGTATEASDYQPVLRVDSLREVSAPRNPYE
ncbi:putative repeat protein (TIGR03943 family) [Tamaricihabitans halophyticus]|uniref:Putative repeat protein (TIGR03943 family) n=1 Tax=Tamaricihabitans halophyticus TaxID=1262583 RepID=A0A4R2QXN1_9PSEU|nr:TIGR03943 family protein [Tamaricihabitans halophyticus]TCP54913.1 putative repeat protein (TIGR03943 family) [Tamaricihabitans halophyticus]